MPLSAGRIPVLPVLDLGDTLTLITQFEARVYAVVTAALVVGSLVFWIVRAGSSSTASTPCARCPEGR